MSTVWYQLSLLRLFTNLLTFYINNLWVLNTSVCYNKILHLRYQLTCLLKLGLEMCSLLYSCWDILNIRIPFHIKIFREHLLFNKVICINTNNQFEHRMISKYLFNSFYSLLKLLNICFI